jgi:polysaccharide export outer membrane protein
MKNSLRSAQPVLARFIPGLLGILTFSVLGGCASYPDWLPSVGPSREKVEQIESKPIAGIEIVEVTDAVARRLLSAVKSDSFSETFSANRKLTVPVNPGDILEVSVWEAPPALLFGAALLDPRSGPATSRVTVMPEQMVSREGRVNVPFAGLVQVAGRSLDEIENDIAKRLAGKANQPQVLVRMLRNNTANVTIVGEVASSTRMPLTPKGERLLDALAAAGGVRQPVNKMTLQLTRGEQVRAMSLQAVIRDPKQNIFLQADDVVTALFQPLSFTALGATGKNEEVAFEAQGITLAQALARAGGLQDARADARGVFIFRFESPALLDKGDKSFTVTPDGMVPVVYRLDLKDPASFFVAQGFPVRDKDVLYVSNAPTAELQKFLGLIATTVYPVLGVVNAAQQ